MFFTFPSFAEPIEVTGNALVHLPPSVEEVIIVPKTYEKPEFAQRVETHYTKNYLLFGLQFVILSAVILSL